MAGESYNPLTAQQQCNIICCKKTIQFEGQAPDSQFNVLRVNGDCPVEGSLLLSLLGSIIYSTGVAKLVWGRPLGSHYTASHGMAIFAYHAGCSWRGQSAARPFLSHLAVVLSGHGHICLPRWVHMCLSHQAGFTCVCLTTQWCGTSRILPRC